MKSIAALLSTPLLLLLLTCSNWQQTNAARILCIVGTPAHNNPGWVLPFFQTLAERGHQLTVIGSQMDADIPGITSVPVSNEYDVIRKHYVDAMGHYQNYWDIKQLLIWYEALLGTCRSTVETLFFKNFNIPEGNFDLIIYDATYSIECLLTKLPQLRSVPVMALSSGKLTTDLLQLVEAENTISAATIPHFASRLPLEMTYWHCLQNHVMYLAERFIQWSVVQPVLNGMLGNGYFNPEVQVVLLNTHPVLDYVQNMPPNVIEVGGLHILSESEPLPFSTQDFIDRFSEGIIYINLPHIELMYGLGIQAIETMIREYGQFGFLWNVNNVKELQLSENFYNLRAINVVENMQQNILAQSNVKVFLSHGDSFSIQESLYNAVPIIVLPLLMDQINNAQRLEDRHLGVRVSPSDFAVNSFSAALKLLIRDDSYLESMQQAQLNYRTRQLKPLDVAVWHAEQLVSQPNLFKHLSVSKSSGMFYLIRKSTEVLIVPLIFLLLFFGNFIFLIWQSINKKKVRRIKEKKVKAKPQEDKKED
ncbi:hypothetical protein AWZ03_005025 [Drosophila navojoa]|uniref:UDP-glycosyltransferases domain-containing protein n=1 Tax=Drosophila navojoa TaxID=7232 RepID=A0A484BL61_DRONA|nr:UDP-glucuronosyltransferase 1-9 [Drosophila navojoa]TDG48481.1 hypothetical protein AWZ03_005025 [Drosophila navojoa]